MGSSPLQPGQRRGARLAAVATVALLVASTFALGCGDDNDEPARFSVRAAVVEPGAPVVVEATAIRNAEGGLLGHEVRVTWRGEGEAVLDDARFTHHARGQGGGDLVIAGRGCGADWDAERALVMHPCTADLQIVRLGPDATHAYPVRVHPEVGPLRLDRARTYAVEEVIRWWAAAEGPATLPEGDPAGQFTIRLTYGPR
jgi:hypothetical protein